MLIMIAMLVPCHFRPKITNLAIEMLWIRSLLIIIWATVAMAMQISISQTHKNIILISWTPICQNKIALIPNPMSILEIPTRRAQKLPTFSQNYTNNQSNHNCANASFSTKPVEVYNKNKHHNALSVQI